MNPWNKLLEALHSSLIDELCERAPEPKPELGMPARFDSLTFPAEACERILLTPVTMAGMKGLGSLAMDPDAEKRLGVNALAVWESLLARAWRSEFPRRGIDPEFEKPIWCEDSSRLPPSLTPPRTVIWIPIRIGEGRCHLAVAV